MPKKLKKSGAKKPSKTPKKMPKKIIKKVAKKIIKKAPKAVKKVAVKTQSPILVIRHEEKSERLTEIKDKIEKPEITQVTESSGEGGEVTPPSGPVVFNDGYKPRDVTVEMQESYLDYAMSVIVARALPDVRDGLKPVHRRILYVMHQSGLSSTSKFKKSATVVGDVLGGYHPHGDTAVYDAMVRLAQDFSMRYPLVQGQGNFGSIDGDSAAAYRYTEARMSKIAEETLADIEKETVDFRDNYDGTKREPVVLPSRLPQLLLNGVSGIAVGMATSIPPHNMREVCEAVIHLADNPDADIDELMQFIKGPDFPTRGIIYDKKAIKVMYATGRGGVVIRARTSIEEGKNGKFRIVITEIPYQVNKSTLVSKIADLVRDKKVVGISDIRDESNREGISVVIELKKEAYPKKILNQLFKYTQLQTTFNMNMIALVEGIQPRLLNLKEVLEYFLAHRKIVITRRTQYELKIAKARSHILEGLSKALQHIDAIIETIKKSATKEDAHVALMKKFALSDLQTKAILEMRLQTLAGLERKKIEDELEEKRKLIKELEGILNDTKKVLNIIQGELKEMMERYGDARSTQIVAGAVGEISNKDTIPNEPMVVVLTRENYIKRMPPTTFRTQHRGGKGVIGMATKDEDEINIISYTKNHDEILFFTNKGRCFKLPVYEIPQASRTSKGQAIVNILNLQPNEIVTAMLTVPEKFTGEYLVMATKMGTIKKTPVADFVNVRKSGLIAIKLRPNDALYWVRQVTSGEEIFMATSLGKSIRFPQKQARPMGRPSQGVRGIRLQGADYVVDMDVASSPETEILVVMENGMGKCTKVSNYRLQSRGGSGVKVANVTPKTGKVVGAKVIQSKEASDLIVVSRMGQTIRLNLQDIPSLGRATSGVYIMRVKNARDKVASTSLITHEEIPEEAKIAERAPGKTPKPVASSPKKTQQAALL
ncbi:MAG: DNA gyrase subunit A [Patescibacteria group bacterium]